MPKPTGLLLGESLYQRICRLLRQEGRRGEPNWQGRRWPENWRHRIRVQNNTGTDLLRYQIVGIVEGTSPFTNADPNLRRLVFSGNTPSPGSHWGRFAVLENDLAYGKTGLAFISGVIQTKVYIFDVNHQYADIHPSADTGEEYWLASSHYGAAQILYRPNTTGLQWCAVRLGIPELLRRFELKDALAPGGTATAHPLEQDGEPDTDVDREFEVVDKYSRHRGRPRDAYSSPREHGSQGTAKYDADSDEWIIITMEQIAPWIVFELADGAIPLTGNANCGAERVSYFGGLDPGTDDTPPEVEVYNTAAADGGNDGYLFCGCESRAGRAGLGPHVGIAFHDIYTTCSADANHGRYRVAAMEPNTDGWNEWEVVTDVAYDGGGHVTGLTKETIRLPDWNPAV